MAHGQRELPQREPSPDFTLPSYCSLCEYWVRGRTGDLSCGMDHHVKTRHHRNQTRKRERLNNLNVVATTSPNENRGVETQQAERTQMPTEEIHQFPQQFPEWNVIERESSRGTEGGAGDEDPAGSLADPRMEDPRGRGGPDVEEKMESEEQDPR